MRLATAPDLNKVIIMIIIIMIIIIIIIIIIKRDIKMGIKRDQWHEMG